MGLPGIFAVIGLALWLHVWFVERDRLLVFDWGIEKRTRLTSKVARWEEIVEVEVVRQSQSVSYVSTPIGEDEAFRVKVKLKRRLPIRLNESLGQLAWFLDDIVQFRSSNPPIATGWSIERL